MKKLLMATVLVLSATPAAKAARTDVLAGGPIFQYGQTSLYCEFINVGTTEITPISQEVFVDGFTDPLDTYDSCANGTAIAPGHTCYIGNSSDDFAYSSVSCVVTFNEPATSVRGAFEIYDANGAVLATVELR